MKSWKTTLAGLGGAIAVALQGTDWKHILVAVAVAALGFFSKDHSAA